MVSGLGECDLSPIAAVRVRIYTLMNEAGFGVV